MNRDLEGISGDEQLYNAIEQVYRVKMTAQENRSLRTVGDLHTLLASKYKPNFAEGCLSAHVFYAIRRALMIVGVPRNKVKRNALLELTIPREDRHWTWATVQGQLGCSLPRLQYEQFLENDIEIFGGLALILVAFGAIGIGTGNATMASWCLPLGVLMYSLYVKSHPDNQIDISRALFFPDGFETYELAVKNIIWWNYGDIVLLSGKWNEEDLFTSLQTLVSSVADIEKQKVQLGTKFADLKFFDQD